MSEFIQKYSKLILVFTALLIFIFTVPLQEELKTQRIINNIEDNVVIVPGEFFSNFVAGGFKGLAADILWIKMDEYWHKGEWTRMLPIVRMITWLQPNFLEAWEIGAWHLAYNFYAYTDDENLKKQFLSEGIRFLQEGIAKNKKRFDLYFNLGWIYYNKVEDFDEAIRFFRMAVYYPHPSYIDRLIAHAYRKKGDYANEVKEWKRAIKLFPSDDYHHKICLEHLKKAEENLSKSK